MKVHRTRLAKLALIGFVAAATAYFLPPLPAPAWMGGLVSSLSSCEVTGVVTLAGRTDHTGVLVAVAGEEPAATNASGAFSLRVTDTVELTVSHDGYLAGEASAVACTGDEIVMADLRLPGGDINQDRRIDLLDLTAVASGYGACEVGTYDERTDVNGSGCTDMLDLVLLGAGYNTHGPIAWAPQSGGGDGAPAAVSFASVVDPILQAECRLCHGDSGGLSFKSYDSLMVGGHDGQAVVPFDREASGLYRRLTGEIQPAMPPGGALLSDNQVALIGKWIDEGAKNN